MILPLPVLQAEMVEIDDAVRYRVYCDQCDAWHFHLPQDGHQDCHCSNPKSIYHRTGYFVELEERGARVLQTTMRQAPAISLLLASVAVATMVGICVAISRPFKIKFHSDAKAPLSQSIGKR